MLLGIDRGWYMEVNREPLAALSNRINGLLDGQRLPRTKVVHEPGVGGIRMTEGSHDPASAVVHGLYHDMIFLRGEAAALATAKMNSTALDVARIMIDSTVNLGHSLMFPHLWHDRQRAGVPDVLPQAPYTLASWTETKLRAAEDGRVPLVTCGSTQLDGFYGRQITRRELRIQYGDTQQDFGIFEQDGKILKTWCQVSSDSDELFGACARLMGYPEATRVT